MKDKDSSEIALATVALEYLHSKFENHDEADAITGQLAVEF